MKYLIACIVMLIPAAYTCHSQAYATKPTKGYYSIGDNYKKLSRPVVLTADTLHAPVIKKGYYALKNHNGKLPGQSVHTSNRPLRLKAQKGYYSIPAHQR